jgi:hypothetical protein
LLAHEDVDPAEAEFGIKHLGWTQLRDFELAEAIRPYWSAERWEIVKTSLRVAEHWGNTQLHVGAAETLRRVAMKGTTRTIDARGDVARAGDALILAAWLFSEIARAAGDSLGIPSLARLGPTHSANHSDADQRFS